MITELGSTASLRGEIEALIRACNCFHDIKTLFWELLGYDRRDEVVSIGELGADLRSLIIEARLFASHDKFHLYHLTVTGEGLSLPKISSIYRFFRRKHRFVVLLVGNTGQTGWNLVYQPDGLGPKDSRTRLAIIRLAHGEEHLGRQSQALSRLRTYDDDDEPLSLLELASAYDGVFAKTDPNRTAKVRVKDGIEILLMEIGRYPLLTTRRERAILEELELISSRQSIQRGNRIKMFRVPLDGFAARYLELRDLLIVHNLRLCFYLSKKYATDQEEILDMFQESVLGLHRAIDLIEPSRNLRFTTYAYQWVRQAITRWIVTQRQLIRLPAHLYELPKGERPQINIICLDSGDTNSRLDLIDESMRSPSTFLEVVEKNDLIRACLARLNPRQATIISRRFGLDGSGSHTLEEIAQSFGLTRERIRQIEEKALGKLHLLLLGQLDVFGEVSQQ